MGSASRFTCALAGVLALSGCASGLVNYPDPAGPRFAGSFTPSRPDAIRVVTFNIKFARRIDRAIQVLRDTPSLRGADILALQEMNEAGAACIAEALSLNYVYYPSSLHPRARGHFGNALLSPWPIRDDRKVVLPHKSRIRGTMRIAVGATIDVRGVPVRAYSVHMETPLTISGGQRRDQLAALLADLGVSTPAVMAGDFNDRGSSATFLQGRGLDWLTGRIRPTFGRFTWDHVFTRGLRPAHCGAVGVVADVDGASDHRPVFADLVPVASSGGETPFACP